MSAISQSSPSTIAEAEVCIQSALERLRDVPFHDSIAQGLSLVAPKGHRIVVQLEEDGRKKRRDASISNWNPSTGEIVIYFEPLAPSPSHPTSHAGPEEKPIAADVSSVSASSSQSELQECCNAMAEAEKKGLSFYALKWFRDTWLVEHAYAWAASASDRKRVLNHAIQEGYILTQTIPNPKNSSFPTTTLSLNREKAKEFVGSRFRPVAIRGEALSATVMRERG